MERRIKQVKAPLPRSVVSIKQHLLSKQRPGGRMFYDTIFRQAVHFLRGSPSPPAPGRIVDFTPIHLIPFQQEVSKIHRPSIRTHKYVSDMSSIDRKIVVEVQAR